ADLDSIRKEGTYRIAIYLTVYSSPATNANSIKYDRIVQETAFDCAAHTLSLISTVSYYQGKRSGNSSEKGDWRERFRAVPRDLFSQRVFDATCNAPLARDSAAAESSGDDAATVRLPPAAAAAE
ncbi:MAG TPA: surface-adhesin E family protein, partial [Acetobacteraceae bacterium]|nr:surface-adhesin E family protein [Acetobacteraceae bacterium]